jgi:hypothetical protein
MDTDKVLQIFASQLADNLARLQSRPKSDTRDVQRIFAVTFESIALLTKGKMPDLSNVTPAQVSTPWIRGIVDGIVKSALPPISPEELEQMKRYTEQLSADLAGPIRHTECPPINNDFRPTQEPPADSGRGEWLGRN